MFVTFKNCETLIKQIHRQPQETLEFKLNEPRGTFFFKPSINLGLDFNWIIGLTNLEGYNSIFNITEQNNKIGLCTDDSDDQFSFVELKDKVAELLHLSHVSPEDLQHELHGPDTIKTYGKLSIEKSKTDGYYLIMIAHRQSSFRDF